MPRMKRGVLLPAFEMECPISRPDYFGASSASAIMGASWNSWPPRAGWPLAFTIFTLAGVREEVARKDAPADLVLGGPCGVLFFEEGTLVHQHPPVVAKISPHLEPRARHEAFPATEMERCRSCASPPTRGESSAPLRARCRPGTPGASRCRTFTGRPSRITVQAHAVLVSQPIVGWPVSPRRFPLPGFRWTTGRRGFSHLPALGCPLLAVDSRP